MRKIRPFLIALPLCVLALDAAAQTQTLAHMTLGEDTLDAAHATFIGDDIHLFGGVTIKAPAYDIRASDVHISLASGAAQGISKVTAEGDPGQGTRVIGHFQQPALGRTYTMEGDRAVYIPDAGRPGGGSIVFSGHPVMTLLAPSLLAEPSVTTSENPITVTLGQGTDYPQISGDALHMTLTPLHQ